MTKELSSQEIDPKNIWSLDEVGFKLNDAKDQYIVSRKGTKNAHSIVSSDTSHISVIFCCNTNGYCLPPYFIVKGKPKEEFLENFRLAGFRSSLILEQKMFL